MAYRALSPADDGPTVPDNQSDVNDAFIDELVQTQTDAPPVGDGTNAYERPAQATTQGITAAQYDTMQPPPGTSFPRPTPDAFAPPPRRKNSTTSIIIDGAARGARPYQMPDRRLEPEITATADGALRVTYTDTNTYYGRRKAPTPPIDVIVDDDSHARTPDGRARSRASSDAYSDNSIISVTQILDPREALQGTLPMEDRDVDIHVMPPDMVFDTLYSIAPRALREGQAICQTAMRTCIHTLLSALDLHQQRTTGLPWGHAVPPGALLRTIRDGRQVWDTYREGIDAHLTTFLRELREVEDEEQQALDDTRGRVRGRPQAEIGATRADRTLAQLLSVIDNIRALGDRFRSSVTQRRGAARQSMIMAFRAIEDEVRLQHGLFYKNLASVSSTVEAVRMRHAKIKLQNDQTALTLVEHAAAMRDQLHTVLLSMLRSAGVAVPPHLPVWLASLPDPRTSSTKRTGAGAWRPALRTFQAAVQRVDHVLELICRAQGSPELTTLDDLGETSGAIGSHISDVGTGAGGGGGGEGEGEGEGVSAQATILALQAKVQQLQQALDRKFDESLQICTAGGECLQRPREPSSRGDSVIARLASIQHHREAIVGRLAHAQRRLDAALTQARNSARSAMAAGADSGIPPPHATTAGPLRTVTAQLRHLQKQLLLQLSAATETWQAARILDGRISVAAAEVIHEQLDILSEELWAQYGKIREISAQLREQNDRRWEKPDSIQDAKRTLMQSANALTTRLAHQDTADFELARDVLESVRRAEGHRMLLMNIDHVNRTREMADEQLTRLTRLMRDLNPEEPAVRPGRAMAGETAPRVSRESGRE